MVGYKRNAEMIGNAAENIRTIESEADQESTRSKKKNVQRQNHKGGIYIDRNCISCSGNMQPWVLQQVRLACLKYEDNQIEIDGNQYSMEEIIR